MAEGVHGDEVRPVITASDATLKGGEGHIHWITISNNHATVPAEIELQDGSVDVWGVEVGDNALVGYPVHIVFDPPIHCDNDIRVDMTNATDCQVTVGIT